MPFTNLGPRTTYLKYSVVAGTDGGTANSGAYTTRPLNLQEGDTSFCSIVANQFILQPGTYELDGFAWAYFCNKHKSKIRNITDSTDQILGDTAYSDTAVNNGSYTPSKTIGSFTITVAKTFEIQTRVQTTRANDALGRSQSNFGDNEIYTEIKITKVA